MSPEASITSMSALFASSFEILDEPVDKRGIKVI